jgi:hypothetical protein
MKGYLNQRPFEVERVNRLALVFLALAAHMRLY